MKLYVMEENAPPEKQFGYIVQVIKDCLKHFYDVIEQSLMNLGLNVENGNEYTDRIKGIEITPYNNIYKHSICVVKDLGVVFSITLKVEKTDTTIKCIVDSVVFTEGKVTDGTLKFKDTLTKEELSLVKWGNLPESYRE